MLSNVVMYFRATRHADYYGVSASDTFRMQGYSYDPWSGQYQVFLQREGWPNLVSDYLLAGSLSFLSKPTLQLQNGHGDKLYLRRIMRRPWRKAQQEYMWDSKIARSLGNQNQSVIDFHSRREKRCAESDKVFSPTGP